MADDVAIVADEIATFFVIVIVADGKPHCEITDDVVTVAEGIATV